MSTRENQSKMGAKLDQLRDDFQTQTESQSGDKLTILCASLLDAIQKAEQSQMKTSSREEIGPLLLEIRDLLKEDTLESRILKQLQFDDLNGRQNAIQDPTEGTFIRSSQIAISQKHHTDTVLNKLEEIFMPWLQSGSGVFHISGKAGSGKSTLMKQIWLHEQTREHLESWAGNKRLLCAAFFFWAAGNHEQKSLTGLFRSILAAVLSQDESLIPKVFPEYYHEEGRSTKKNPVGLITAPHVVEGAFQKFLESVLGSGYRVCLFIDGLDEYEAADRASYWELAERFAGWADRSDGDVKLCVSSRPYREFLATFAPCPDSSRIQIHLHQFNRSDIEIHCRAALLREKSRSFSTGIKCAEEPFDQTEEFSEYLIGEIGRRAEGVFLWAVLVIRIIVAEAKRGGSHEYLRKKLDETPDDMDKLYAKMLGSLKRSEKQLAIRILFTVLTNPFSQNVSALCLSWLINKDAWQSRPPHGDSSDMVQKATAGIEQLSCHLDLWTQGLAEIGERYGFIDHPLFTTRVTLFHRTAKDFLSNATQDSELLSAFDGFDFINLHADLRLAELAMLKCIGPSIPYGYASVYGYEMLIRKGYRKPDTNGNHIADYQLTSAAVNQLFCYFPTQLAIPIFDKVDYNKHNILICSVSAPDSHRPSIHHFCAALGLDDKYTSKEQMATESESCQSNLLLSASLSGLFFGNCPVAGKVSSPKLVKILLERGFSASEKVKLVGPGANPTGNHATVWMILISCLIGIEHSRCSSDGRREIASVLGELLRAESQEEVLVLGTYRGARGYNYFITLKDLIHKCNGMTAWIPNELQSWPSYEGGSSSCENTPTWVWEGWDSRSSSRSLHTKLDRLSPESDWKAEDVELKAVVSRKNMLENIGYDTPSFLVW